MALSRVFANLVLAVSAFVCGVTAHAQVRQDWKATIQSVGNHPAGTGNRKSLAVDADGNVYVTGNRHNGNNATSNDYVTAKYSSAGALLWTKNYNGIGNGNDAAYALTLDATGNVYVVGTSWNGSSLDYVTVKYNSVGVQQWASAHSIGTSNVNVDMYLATDADGNVILAAQKWNGANKDYLVVKYNSAGVQQWFATYDGPGNSADTLTALAVDPGGNVYVTGFYYDTAHRDVTVKYSSAGSQEWVASYSGPVGSSTVPYDLAVDATGNAYLAGSVRGTNYEEFLTIKYNSAGTRQWDARFGGAFVAYALRLALDAVGNVFVAGQRTVGGLADFVTLKYDPTGVELWMRVFEGLGQNNDWVGAIALDPGGNVYVSGSSFNGVRRYDYAVVKYNPAGTQQWVAAYDGSNPNADTWQAALVVDGSGNVYVLGESYEGISPYLAITLVKYSQRKPRVDFDGDGKSDVLWRNGATGENYAYLMSGYAITGGGYLPTVPTTWVIRGVGDFDGDGKADILWRNTTTGENYLYFMNGLIQTSGGYLPTVPTTWAVIGVGDFDGDGRSDILWRNATTGENYIYFLNGLTLTSGGYLPTVPSNWVMVGLGDLNGDGRADIVWRNTISGENYAYLMNGLTITSQGYLPTVPLEWAIAGTGDFDGDGKADIVWRNFTTGENYIYRMNGQAVVAGGYLPTVPTAWHVFGAGDYDGDGKDDLLWRNTTSGESYLYLMNGLTVASGGFLPTTPTSWFAVRTSAVSVSAGSVPAGGVAPPPALPPSISPVDVEVLAAPPPPPVLPPSPN